MTGAYKETLIKSRSEKDKVRKHIEVYFGHSDIRGAEYAVSEIIVNAVDEAVEKHANTIKITVEEDNTVTVEDNGWGVPLGFNEGENKFNWELIFCTLFASGKYDSEGYAGNVLGKHGVGCSATQFASEFMDITAWKNENGTYKQGHISFKKGDVDEKFTDVIVKGVKSGTRIQFKLDAEIFSDIEITSEFFHNISRYSTMFLSNLTIYLKYKTENIIKYHFDSPVEYMERISKDPNKVIIHAFGESTGVDKEDAHDYDNKKYTVQMGAVCSFNEPVEYLELFHNRVLMKDKGITEESFIKQLVNVFSTEARKRGLMKKNENFLVSDLTNSIFFLGWTEAKGNVSKYHYQNKTAVSNQFIGVAYSEFLEKFFYTFINDYPEKANGYLQKALLSKKAREAGELAKMKAFKNINKSSDDLATMDDKLIPCESNNPEITELYLAEGDSAMGACKLARDPYFQAIYSLGGKPINCMKNDVKKVLSNEKVQGNIKALGCGIQLPMKSKGKNNIAQFDIDKLRYNKIIIATDADDDGKHIRCLTLTLFWVYMPELIRQGKVYIVESPLYEIKTRKGSKFAYSDEEKDQIIAGITEKYEVLRSKGLGENNTAMMRETTMDPKTRRLIQVLPGKMEEDMAAMEALMGKDMENRKMIISELFSVYSGGNDE